MVVFCCGGNLRVPAGGRIEPATKFEVIVALVVQDTSTWPSVPRRYTVNITLFCAVPERVRIETLT